MCEAISGILNYLPISRDKIENEYIEHLRETFLVLESSKSLAPPFSVVPFHLLFMMAVQYKVLRIYNEQRRGYQGAIAKISMKKRVKKQLRVPTSPTAIGFLNENKIISILKIAGLSDADKEYIKNSIIDYRNDNLAHAKGYIELHLELKFNEYFSGLEFVQKAYREMNRNVAESWLGEVTKNDDIGEFFENQLSGSHLCPRDLVDVVSVFLKSNKLDYVQQKQAVQKLRQITIRNPGNCWCP